MVSKKSAELYNMHLVKLTHASRTMIIKILHQAFVYTTNKHFNLGLIMYGYKPTNVAIVCPA